MHIGILVRAAFAATLCILCTKSFAEIAIYDFEGLVTERSGTQSLPAEIAKGRPFDGVVVVDLTAPPGERLRDLTIGFRNLGAEVFAIDPTRPRSVSLSNSTDSPRYDLAALSGSTAAGINMVLNWAGEPGAALGFPPEANEDTDLSTLVPRQRWTLAFGAGSSSATGTIVTFNRRNPPDEYAEDFDDGVAQDWTPRSGEWAVESGYYRNLTNAAFPRSVNRAISMPEQFVLFADVFMSWGNTGNTAGLVWNYGGGSDEFFFELRLNARGTATVSQFLNGQRTTLASGTYPGAGTGRWASVYVKHDQWTQIEINGKQVFHESISGITGGGIGVFSSWNMARFDNLILGRPIVTADTAFVAFDPQDGNGGFVQRSGIWRAFNGKMHSSSNQASSINVFEPLFGVQVYEIAATIRSDWSAPGNQSGFVYDYLDANNYREARVRLGSNRIGTLFLNEVVNGVRREVARKDIPLPENYREIRLRLTCEADRVTFGRDPQSSLYVQQSRERNRIKYAGLMTSWNLATFDDVVVYRVNTQ